MWLLLVVVDVTVVIVVVVEVMGAVVDTVRKRHSDLDWKYIC